MMDEYLQVVSGKSLLILITGLLTFGEYIFNFFSNISCKRNLLTGPEVKYELNGPAVIFDEL